MSSLFMCKADNFRNLRADQYVPIVWLEMISKLHAHNRCLINMLIINKKQLQTHAGRCVKEGTLSRLTKLNRNFCNEGMKREPNFQKGTFQVPKGKKTVECPGPNVFLINWK